MTTSLESRVHALITRNVTFGDEAKITPTADIFDDLGFDSLSLVAQALLDAKFYPGFQPQETPNFATAEAREFLAMFDAAQSFPFPKRQKS